MLFKKYIYYFYFNKEEKEYIIKKNYFKLLKFKLDKDFYKLLFNKNNKLIYYIFSYICYHYSYNIDLINYWLNKQIEIFNDTRNEYDGLMISGICSLIKANKPNLSLIKEFIDLLDNPTENDYYMIYNNLLHLFYSNKSLLEYVKDKFDFNTYINYLIYSCGNNHNNDINIITYLIDQINNFNNLNIQDYKSILHKLIDMEYFDSVKYVIDKRIN